MTATSPQVGVLVLPGAVVLSGDALLVVVSLLDSAQAARRRNGLPPARVLTAISGAAQQAVAAQGHTATPGAPSSEAEAMNYTSRTVTVEAAAERLGLSRRQARRLAPQLGGRKTGGVWLVDEAAITEHLAGRNTA